VAAVYSNLLNIFRVITPNIALYMVWVLKNSTLGQ